MRTVLEISKRLGDVSDILDELENQKDYAYESVEDATGIAEDAVSSVSDIRNHIDDMAWQIEELRGLYDEVWTAINEIVLFGETLTADSIK